MSILIVLPLSLLFTLVFLLHRHKNSKPSKMHSPPGPSGLPFIGNLHQVDTSCLHECLWKLSKKYGPLMSLRIGSIPTLVVSSAKLAEEVMKHKDTVFCSRPQLQALKKLTYNGMDVALGPYGQEWREMRKIAVLHLLSAKRIQQFRPIREDELSRMMQKIRREAELGKVTNLSETLSYFTSTSTCRMAFGKRLDEESHARKRFDHLLHDAEAIAMEFFFADFFPSIGWMDNLTGMPSRLEGVFKKFDAFFQELIDEHLDPNRPKSMDDDIIDIMLQLQRDGSTSFHITMDHIKAMLLDVFTAGTETSAASVTWAMTALMKNPEVIKKLQDEIREEMGGKQVVEEDDIEKLPYLKATVKEAMRLHLVVPLLLPRESMETCYINGYKIQPKTLVYVNGWSIARDPEVWDRPDEFLPERFLNSGIDMKGNDFMFIPFGSGRRSCPGYAMGLVFVHLLLANLMNSFDWELPPGMKAEDIDTECLPGITMVKKNALNLAAKLPPTANFSLKVGQKICTHSISI